MGNNTHERAQNSFSYRLICRGFELPIFHNLNENPGLLILNLGTGQNIIDYWSFIQIFDISLIIEQFSKLQTQFQDLVSHAHFKNEQSSFDQLIKLVHRFENKIMLQVTQLNPTLAKRSKRGLINGLGNIIKTITGNLDQEDAQKYDKAIVTLSENDRKFKTLLKEQITLLHASVQNFENTTRTLIQNDHNLEGRLVEIQNIISKLQTDNVDIFNHFLTQMFISQVLLEYQMMSDFLERIEVAITFAKLNTLHNSIVEPNDLLQELTLIQNHLSADKLLPFLLTVDQILNFEKIIEIKSYIKDNQIVMIIEIPLVEKNNYNYYHLYPIPVPKNNNFHVIIPQSKYLLVHEQNYILSDEKCVEASSQRYLCHGLNPIQIQGPNPCELQLLKYTEKIGNCSHLEVELNNLKIQKIEGNKWLLITPRRIVVVVQCGNNVENVPLSGAYLIETTDLCEIRAGPHTIKTYRNKSPNFKMLNLPQLQIEEKVLNSTVNFKKINLDLIDLENLKNVKEALGLQIQTIEEIDDSLPIHHVPSVWTVLLYLLIIIVICLSIRKYIQRRKARKHRNTQDQPQNNDHAT